MGDNILEYLMFFLEFELDLPLVYIESKYLDLVISFQI